MIRTRLTERFGLSHPIISAPMAFAAGGRLAAAVSNAGGLGLIGGGYGDGGMQDDLGRRGRCFYPVTLSVEWIGRQAYTAAPGTPVKAGRIH